MLAVEFVPGEGLVIRGFCVYGRYGYLFWKRVHRVKVGASTLTKMKNGLVESSSSTSSS
jgi:hypothetical protein